MAEAVQELRDKAGTQFHPLVAHAFSSMIEGQPLQSAIGQSQLAALRAEFSRIPTLRLPRVSALFSPPMLAVCSAAATLVAIGIPGVSLLVTAGIGALTLALTGITLTESISARRRRRWVGAVLSAGGSAEAALDAAGVVGWAVWLKWMPDAERYEALMPGDVDAGDLVDMCRRALRTGFTPESGVLDSGAHFTITPVTGDMLRLAFCSPRRLSRFELGLLAEIAARAVPPLIDEADEPASLTLVEGDQRSGAAVTKVGTVIIDLGVFENVRVAAGQLTAERVVADAIGRLRMLLRTGDVIEQLGEDRLGALIAVSDESQLEVVCNRMRATLDGVPVPRRAAAIDATIVYSVNAELSGNPELAGVLRRLTGEQRAAG